MTSSPTRRLRVLWLVKGLGPGGAERLLLLAARELDRGRFDLQVSFVRPDKTHLVPDFEASGVTPQRLGRGMRSAAWLRALRSQLRDRDIVHAHSPVVAVAARVLARTLPRNARPIVVTTEHNLWSSHRFPTRLANALTAPLDAHRYAVSPQVVQSVWGPWRAGYQVLLHGIDVNAVRAAGPTRDRVRQELGLRESDILSLTVANLRRTKDYPNLLKAAQIAIGEEPNLVVAAVGQGPLAGAIAQLHAELGLGSRVLLLGFRRDVHELMAAADVLTVSSAHEGLPVAVMEAFAAGLPVVATSVGGIPQQVHHGVEGLLVEPGNSPALAQALVALARDGELREQLAQAARRRATDYDISVCVRAHEALYERLAGHLLKL